MAEEKDPQVDQNNQNNENGNKDHKSFLSVVNSIFALINEDSVTGLKSNVFSKKIPNDQVSGVMERLLKGRTEKAKEEFATKMDALLDRFAEFQIESRKRKKAFEDAEIAKEKEFTKEAQAVLGSVQNLQEYLKMYKNGVNLLEKEQGNE